MTTSITGSYSPTGLPDVFADGDAKVSHAKPLVMATQPMSAQSPGLTRLLEGQVAPQLELGLDKLKDMSPADRIIALTDISDFDENEMTTLMLLMMIAGIVKAVPPGGETAIAELGTSETGHEGVSEKMKFNAFSLEGQISVLLAAIAAIIVAREAGAEMQGKFAIMAHAAALAQGISISEAGKAAMLASMGAVVMAVGFSLAGGITSLKGHSASHTNIKVNVKSANLMDSKISSLKADLAHMQPKVGTGPNSLNVHRNGGTEAVEFIDQTNQPGANNMAVLEQKIREFTDQKNGFSFSLQFNQAGIDKTLLIGGTLLGLSMAISAGVSSILLVAKYAAEHTGVLHEADKGLHKSLTDTEAQTVAEDTQLIASFLEKLKGMLDNRAGTIAHIAQHA